MAAVQSRVIPSKRKGAEIDRIFAPWDRPDTPGAAVVVIRDGQVIHKKGYGMANLEWGVPNTPRTVFCVGSVSKQFTAYAVALLAGRGRVLLDEDYRAYIPEMPDYGVRITVGDLVHHTSGLRDDQMILYLGDWERGELHGAGAVIDDILARQKGLLFKPGEAFDYSNSNYCLLGEIVRRTSGMSLREFARTAVFEPLGMTSTLFLDDFREVVRNRAWSYVRTPGSGYKAYIDTNDQVGAGGVHTTVEDMALWIARFDSAAAGGPGVIGRILSPGRLRNGEEVAYGFGLELDTFKGRRVVRHDGSYGGFNAMDLRFPDDRFAVFCAANAGDLDARAACYRIARLYLKDKLIEPAPDARPVIRLDARTLKSLAGDYRNRKNMDLMTVKVAGNHLVCKINEDSGADYAPVSAREFRCLAPGRTPLLDFAGPGSSPASGLRSRRDGKTIDIYERIERATPSPEALREYAGAYFSGEMSASYRFEVRDGSLYVCFKRAPKSALRPLVKDQFAAWPLIFDFDRAGDGSVSGFRLGRIGPDGIPFNRIEACRTGR